MTEQAKLLSNLNTLGDLVGTFVGIGEGVQEKSYLQEIIRDAHSQTTKDFDIAAAATAKTGALKHVYEFGTVGITPGKPKYSDATSPEAYLWRHIITGSGGNQDIGFYFRPALNPNPVPTTGATGVATKYLRKISRRKYVFYNKAIIMESGATIQIRAKRGDFLFIPFNNHPAENPTNKRGFVMYNTSKKGPITTTPGASTKGKFGAYWISWWGSEGERLIEEKMYTRVSTDIEMQLKKLAETTKSENMTTPAQTKIASRSASMARKVKEWFMK